MATFEVTINGQRYEVSAPDEASAVNALRGQFPDAFPAEAPQEQPNPFMDALGSFGRGAQSTFAGAAQGATLGAYDEIAAALGAPIKGVENLLSGQDQIDGAGDILPFLGRSFEGALGGQRALNRQAYEQAPAAFIGGEILGSLGLGGGMGAAGVSGFGSVARPTIMGMAGRGALEGGTTGFGNSYNSSESDDLIDRLSAGAAGGVAGAGLGAVTGGVLGGMAGRAQSAAVPSSDRLQSAGGDIYDAVRSSGKAASPAEFDTLVNKLDSVARSRNVITPEGNVNATYSALGAPLALLDEYRRTGRPISVDELLTLRGNIRDAAAAPDQKVSSLGMQMFDEFNDYIYKLAPEIQQADDLYWRGKTGELIDRLGQLATSRAGQYSQSGSENALRAEFRLLERQIINGKVKGLPPELVEQIGKVAQGDEIQNFARWMSKFGAQNPITASGGVAAGFATGSPLTTLGIWGGAQAAGGLARALAGEKYRGASALARAGGDLPAWEFAPGAAALVQGAGAQGGPTIANAISQALYGRPTNER